MGNWFVGVMSLIVGVLTGWITHRVARKTPHEQLKHLTEIRQQLGNLDRQGVVNAAIQRELRRLKDLTEAREVGIIRYARIWAKLNPGTASMIASTVVFINLALAYQFQDIIGTSSLIGMVLLVLLTIAPIASIALSHIRMASTERNGRERVNRMIEEAGREISRCQADAARRLSAGLPPMRGPINRVSRGLRVAHRDEQSCRPDAATGPAATANSSAAAGGRAGQR